MAGSRDARHWMPSSCSRVFTSAIWPSCIDHSFRHPLVLAARRKLPLKLTMKSWMAPVPSGAVCQQGSFDSSWIVDMSDNR
jgi:hypothetical protein